MSQQKPVLPVNVVGYVRKELDRRTGYKEQLESLPVYNGYDDFHRREYEGKKLTLERAITDIEKGVIAIVKKHFPSIEVDTNNEVTIANILAALPTPQEVRHVTQASARGQV